MESNIMMLVTVFIGVAIMLSVGVMILGNASSGFDCTDLSGNSTSGWQKACNDIQSQAQDSFNLLVVILIVVAAVAILVVIRML